MEHADVTDLYEAAYLLCEDCQIEGVQCIPVSRSMVCSIRITGEGLPKKRETFNDWCAEVNLHTFRNAYTRVNGLVHEAQKAWWRERNRGKEPRRVEGQRQVEL
ncbi:MAG: hypothetical protein FWC45_00680 [Treponema sp.]|nr:hypothetical protein [Treponema sp.]